MAHHTGAHRKAPATQRDRHDSRSNTDLLEPQPAVGDLTHRRATNDKHVIRGDRADPGKHVRAVVVDRAEHDQQLRWPVALRLGGSLGTSTARVDRHAATDANPTIRRTGGKGVHINQIGTRCDYLRFDPRSYVIEPGPPNRADVRQLRRDLFEPVRTRFALVSNLLYLPLPDGAVPEHGLARAWEAGVDGRVSPSGGHLPHRPPRKPWLAEALHQLLHAVPAALRPASWARRKKSANSLSLSRSAF